LTLTCFAATASGNFTTLWLALALALAAGMLITLVAVAGDRN